MTRGLSLGLFGLLLMEGVRADAEALPSQSLADRIMSGETPPRIHPELLATDRQNIEAMLDPHNLVHFGEGTARGLTKPEDIAAEGAFPKNRPIYDNAMMDYLWKKETGQYVEEPLHEHHIHHDEAQRYIKTLIGRYQSQYEDHRKSIRRLGPNLRRLHGQSGSARARAAANMYQSHLGQARANTRLLHSGLVRARELQKQIQEYPLTRPPSGGQRTEHPSTAGRASSTQAEGELQEGLLTKAPKTEAQLARQRRRRQQKKQKQKAEKQMTADATPDQAPALGPSRGSSAASSSGESLADSHMAFPEHDASAVREPEGLDEITHRTKDMKLGDQVDRPQQAGSEEPEVSEKTRKNQEKKAKKRAKKQSQSAEQQS